MPSLRLSICVPALTFFFSACDLLMRVRRGVPRDASSQLASLILAVAALKVIEIGSESEDHKMERLM